MEIQWKYQRLQNAWLCSNVENNDFKDIFWTMKCLQRFTILTNTEKKDSWNTAIHVLLKLSNDYFSLKLTLNLPTLQKNIPFLQEEILLIL